ncbi:Integral membrane family protein [Colletotrichum higginsianum IMI 349063]|uniref:Integral membrane family protein n=1 Tax=Colletotrichum higginsianum (strain IMI 349063) TaxID=759273 RepID=A0A1B7YS08_COLHI|nr:Integral membrane family protein [Colletotrichum higginsianum IMI 349063]OBR14678.1 Integral membrane family protein [Colletotrichum higginsianum IMI 349063]
MEFISNPDDDERPTVLAATLTVTCVAILIVVARLWVRLGIIHSFGLDDGFMTFATAISIAGQAVLITQVRHGVGRHTGDIDFSNDYPTAMKMSFVSQPLYLATICLVKLAVGSSLLRIASKKLYKNLIIGVMALMTVYTIACIFVGTPILLQCTDVRIFWDFNVRATCWDVATIKGLSYANSSVNILTDLLFGVAIPAPMLWSLKVPSRVRMSLLIVLGLGVFACAAACVKVYYVVMSYGRAFDPTWDSRHIQMWTVIEANVGIIAGSLPTLRPLFKGFLGSVYGKGSKAPTGANYYGRGTLRSGSNWQTLSNTKWPVNTSEAGSERALRSLRDQQGEEYELGAHAGEPARTTTVMAGTNVDDSDESVDKVMLPSRLSDGGGIKKTTVTTIMYSGPQ